MNHFNFNFFFCSISYDYNIHLVCNTVIYYWQVMLTLIHSELNSKSSFRSEENYFQ